VPVEHQVETLVVERHPRVCLGVVGHDLDPARGQGVRRDRDVRRPALGRDRVGRQGVDERQQQLATARPEVECRHSAGQGFPREGVVGPRRLTFDDRVDRGEVPATGGLGVALAPLRQAVLGFHAAIVPG
jgi:hypothetical protein